MYSCGAPSRERRVRRARSSLDIVLATADITVPPKVSMQEGVVEYVVKPLDRERVMAAVSRAVEWRQAALARGPKQPMTRDPIPEWLGGGQGGRRKPDGDSD